MFRAHKLAKFFRRIGSNQFSILQANRFYSSSANYPIATYTEFIDNVIPVHQTNCIGYSTTYNSWIEGAFPLNSVYDILVKSIWLIKRTFQPSLLRRKRKHGFLARIRTRGGVKILQRRKKKGRTHLCP